MQSKIGGEILHNALRLAIRHDLREMVKLLLSHIKDFKNNYSWPIPIFLLPVYYNNHVMLEILIKHAEGIDFYCVEENGYNALDLAAKYGAINILEILLSHPSKLRYLQSSLL